MTIWLVVAVGIAFFIQTAMVIVLLLRPTDNLGTAEERSRTRMFELGQQWAVGFEDGSKDNPNKADFNALYGICVIEAAGPVKSNYGDTGASSWLDGCLEQVRLQQFPSSVAPIPTN